MTSGRFLYSSRRARESVTCQPKCQSAVCGDVAGGVATRVNRIRTLFGDWSAASGYEAGCHLAARPGVSAVFAANDQMALGVMRALTQAGRRIPEDVSVAGFDDLDEAPYFSPPLTTVRQDFDVVAEQIVSMMVGQIETGRAPSATALIAPRLIVRESTGAPPAR